MDTLKHKISNSKILDFILAGKSTITALSKSGKRFTYKIQKAKDNPLFPAQLEDGKPWFVSVLQGPDNQKDYGYLGVIFRNDSGFVFNPTAKSQISPDAPSSAGFKWILRNSQLSGIKEEDMQFQHSGKCCVCGKKLTTPESLVAGIGPVCEGNMNRKKITVADLIR